MPATAAQEPASRIINVAQVNNWFPARHGLGWALSRINSLPRVFGTARLTVRSWSVGAFRGRKMAVDCAEEAGVHAPGVLGYSGRQLQH